jgi:hypothetical protein
MSLTALSDRLIAALPPAMVVLVLLNIVCLGFVGWSFTANTEARNAMIGKVLDACLVQRGNND